MSYNHPVLSLLVAATLVGCSADTSPTGSGNLAAVEVSLGDASNGVSGSVTGSAMVQVFAANGLGLRRLTFNAHVLNDGSIAGEWNLIAGATILHGDIDCLTILPDGKSARMSGIITDAKFTTFIEGTAFALEVLDNGQGNGNAPDETTDLRSFRNAPPEVGRAFCETGEAPDGLELMPIIKGNVQVHTN